LREMREMREMVEIVALGHRRWLANRRVHG
jgi:hypothetical protein